MSDRQDLNSRWHAILSPLADEMDIQRALIEGLILDLRWACLFEDHPLIDRVLGVLNEEKALLQALEQQWEQYRSQLLSPDDSGGGNFFVA